MIQINIGILLDNRSTMRQSYNLFRGNFLRVNIPQSSEFACCVKGSGKNHLLSSVQSEAAVIKHGDPHRILFQKNSSNTQIYNGVTIQYCSLGN